MAFKFTYKIRSFSRVAEDVDPYKFDIFRFLVQTMRLHLSLLQWRRWIAEGKTDEEIAVRTNKKEVDFDLFFIDYFYYSSISLTVISKSLPTSV